MSKDFDEITAEVLGKLVLARANAFNSSAIGNSTHLDRLIKENLSDEAVAASYKAIYKSVREAAQGK